MVGRASPVLTRPRGGALVALLAALAAWEALAGRLPDAPDRVDVALVAAVLIPATFAAAWLALPVAEARGVLALAVATGVLAVLLDLAGLDAAFNVAKLAAYALFGFWFLRLFEELSWIVLVAAVIPWVDVLSVYRGPTKVVVEEQPGLFERISIAFTAPGDSGSVNIGPPDVIFFALFLAAAARFGLRVTATWACMTCLLSLTLVATYAFDLDGLPALPAVSLGFLLPNADLLWASFAAWRARRGRAAA